MTATLTARDRVYSARQHRLIMSLHDERETPVAGRSLTEAQLVERLFDLAGNHAEFDTEHDKFVAGREASAIIDWLFTLPKKTATVQPARPTKPAELEPGVYEVEAGKIYVVKPNRDKTRLYAKRLVEIGGDRLVETDEHVHIEFVYEAGAIFSILPEHKMDVERAKALTIRYGRCIACGRHLKNGVSVERGIGPVCIKSFRR